MPLCHQRCSMSPPRHFSRPPLVKSPATLCQRLYQCFVSHFEQVVLGKASQRMSQPHHPAAPSLHQDFRHQDRMRHARDLREETSGKKKGCKNRSREGSFPMLPQCGHLWKESRKGRCQKRSHTHCSSEWGLDPAVSKQRLLEEFHDGQEGASSSISTLWSLQHQALIGSRA